MQLVRSQVLGEAFVVLHPDLADVGRARILVEHLADLSVDVVHRIVVEARIVVAVGQQPDRVEVHVRQIFGLGHAVCDVDAEAVDPAVEPEPKGAFEIFEDLGVLPVQIGLLGGEDVQIPLAG